MASCHDDGAMRKEQAWVCWWHIGTIEKPKDAKKIGTMGAMQRFSILHRLKFVQGYCILILPKKCGLVLVIVSPKRVPQKSINSNSFSTYFTKMKALWNELNSFKVVKPCTCEHGKSSTSTYKIDYWFDGIVERYKARLVAKGFHISWRAWLQWYICSCHQTCQCSNSIINCSYSELVSPSIWC